MRILIDECIDERMRNFLPGHYAETARYAGFAGLQNGALVSAAEAARFDVLLTIDRGFEFEQNIRGRRIAIVILQSKSNRLKDLLPLLPSCLSQLDSLVPGQILRIGSEARA